MVSDHEPGACARASLQRKDVFPRALADNRVIQQEGEYGRFLSLSDDWSELISGNLVGKYKALYAREPSNQRLLWKWDEAYLAKAEMRGKRLSALKKIHGIDVRGWLAPFGVEGSQDLIELGYEAGFGARNSMGFGMAEPAAAFAGPAENVG